MEIITEVERRRHWRVEDELRIVAETEHSGACFIAVARRHEVCRNLWWTGGGRYGAALSGMSPRQFFCRCGYPTHQPFGRNQPLSPTPTGAIQAASGGNIEVTLSAVSTRLLVQHKDVFQI